ncbi:hypothetical protein HK44_008450 [Pseudomonas fluorescens HK44]|uniref:Uncharacterized protein n=1 Tax=Pseudomonas fluorescens HK44 TaxID=1042209 RepID=A0A010RNR7_PSEFL|nr:hypothetical protein HK44_008450 [Pseudomonas fluorescens HK44]
MGIINAKICVANCIKQPRALHHEKDVIYSRQINYYNFYCLRKIDR